MTTKIDDDQIARNAEIHDRIALRYDRQHSEIFNDREQARLASSLDAAVSAVQSATGRVSALDMGCGTGNLTRHLLALDCSVVAADLSQSFLDLITNRFAGRPVQVARLNGRDLAQFADRQFDLVATYSVLHHIPDYLAAVREMGRVCATGGVVYIDHEADEDAWVESPERRRYRSEVARTDWRKFLRPINYYGKVRRLFEPRYANEGDIHVWADDHIEWERIREALGSDFEVVLDNRFLLFDALFRPEVYERYRDRLTDMRVMAFRRTR